ncbi:MAG: class I SAM-dependent methyltransferase [Deltaproteobacteria bacterium]|nr:class I SAM-dependent methyltransferase [bacterium]MCB9477728.1 class I SAM-dependent methyltransferase [Deltaproteobacteria bacterium]MCB9478857.1 class I SAM-dependent methyltransferase [Deltaproteobacteria bacterium]MCB9488981.1 class I SAM-dependent methyltransferase [Deltaproteobacteria bacterium]
MNDLRRLDLGCGPRKTPGFFGVDHAPFEGVDLVHDLRQTPWPLDESSFDEVVASHIIEHLDDVPAFLREIHRVCRDGAVVRIITPHYSNRSSYLDPTHRHAFSARFLELLADAPEWRPSGSFAIARSYLFEHHHTFHTLIPDAPFDLRSVDLSFARFFRYLGIDRFANWKIDFYEFYLAWMLPARDITAELVVRKSAPKDES